ncbi:MAG: hypothetical protein IKL54_07765 [Bacteroidaceae bacterium]|nr:hypothetical protein [Bacteroidaceae bacterium]
MELHKKITIWFLSAILLVSCGNNSKQELENLNEQYDALSNDYRDAVDNLNDQIAVVSSKDKIIEQTIADLTEITGLTGTLLVDIETGIAKTSQADKIASRIQYIRERLDTLQVSDERNKKMVALLQAMVTSRDSEIKQLKSIIRQKDRTIRVQNDTIKQQYDRLKETNKELKKELSKNKSILTEAGDDMMRLAENLPDINNLSLGGNKKKMDALKRDLYNLAQKYYSAGKQYLTGKNTQVQIKLNEMR